MRSRFDKRRLYFPEWTAETAVSAMVKASARDRMKLTVEAEDEALRLFKVLRRLPHWASARDFDTVYKSMFQKRARRLGKLLREKMQCVNEVMVPLTTNQHLQALAIPNYPRN